MSVDWPIELAWKSAVLAGAVIGVLAIARSRSAAEKALVGDIGLLSLLILPMSMAGLPSMELAPPSALGAALDDVTQASAVQFGQLQSSSVATEAASVDWRLLAIGMYLVPVALLLGGLINGLMRLGRLYRDAEPLADPVWLAAIAAARSRLGVKQCPTLLLSDAISSPISWGVIRPVIVIDPIARADAGRAEAIIAHELAHLQRFDWLKLVLSRLVIAMFWFNPLVWMLSRLSHLLREQAADDVVLREVAKSDYADLLLTTSRYANARPALAANGVAPGRSSLSQRIQHVLHPSKTRRPAALEYTSLAIALALGANAAVASTQLVAERGWTIVANAADPARADPAAIWPLLLELRNDDPAIRLRTLKALARMRPSPGPLATPVVSRLLRDPVAQVRAEAALTIGSFPGIRNSRSIEKMLLRDPSAQTRLNAAQALGRIRDHESQATLKQALRDPDASVRARAQWALDQIGAAPRR